MGERIQARLVGPFACIPPCLAVGLVQRDAGISSGVGFFVAGILCALLIPAIILIPALRRVRIPSSELLLVGGFLFVLGSFEVTGLARQLLLAMSFSWWVGGLGLAALQTVLWYRRRSRLPDDTGPVPPAATDPDSAPTAAATAPDKTADEGDPTVVDPSAPPEPSTHPGAERPGTTTPTGVDPDRPTVARSADDSPTAQHPAVPRTADDTPTAQQPMVGPDPDPRPTQQHRGAESDDPTLVDQPPVADRSPRDNRRNVKRSWRR